MLCCSLLFVGKLGMFLWLVGFGQQQLEKNSHEIEKRESPKKSELSILGTYACYCSLHHQIQHQPVVRWDSHNLRSSFKQTDSLRETLVDWGFCICTKARLSEEKKELWIQIMMKNTTVCFFVTICSILFAMASSMATKPIVIGTRGSPLALAQAYETKVCESVPSSFCILFHL